MIRLLQIYYYAVFRSRNILNIGQTNEKFSLIRLWN